MAASGSAEHTGRCLLRRRAGPLYGAPRYAAGTIAKSCIYTIGPAAYSLNVIVSAIGPCVFLGLERFLGFEG